MSRHDRPLRPLWHLLPSGYSVPFVALGTAWFLLFGSCGGVLTIADVASGTADAENLSGAALAFGLFLLPVSGLLLFIGALLAGKWAARTVLLAATLFVHVAAMLTALLGVLLDESPLEGAAVMGGLFAVPTGLLGLALLGSGVLAFREVRASVHRARRERLRELVAARGEVDAATIARELRLPQAQVGPLLERWVTSGELTAILDPEAQMAFSPRRYAQKQRDLLSVVWGRGKATLTELAAELRLSPEHVRRLLVAALGDGSFTGFFDARSGEVVSAPSARLRDGRTCPACGGQMDLAGHGVVVCRYCRAEVFLAP